MTTWEGFLRVCEDQEFARIYAKLCVAISELDEGRNTGELRCFPIASFGGKDADLNPEGCTGIESIAVSDAEDIVVVVSGHKTFCPDEDWSEGDTDYAQEIVADCGYHCEWTGDEWVASFKATIKVPWILRSEELALGDKDAEDYAATAAAILEAAQRALSGFSKECADVDAALDNIVKEREEHAENADD